MPLDESGSKESVSRNIATEIRAGRDPKQAAAIAYSVARKNGARVGVPKRSGKVGVKKK